MRLKPLAALLLATGLVSGCRTYEYQLVQPPQLARRIADKELVTVHFDPLDYQFQRYQDRLMMRITNPTDHPISLLASRSYAIDPRGESHPLPGRVLGPHSFATMLLPPRPASMEVVGGYGPGWGWAPGFYAGLGYAHPPFYGGFYDDFYYGPPPVTYYNIITPYDWNWGTGPARLRLTYEAQGKTFEHDFEFVRQRAR